jgi:hypothetical protein
MQTTLSPKEIGERGRAIYEANIKAKVEAEHFDEFLMLDINTGDYEIGTDEIELSRRLRARHPDGVFHMLRIGARATYSLGGAL